MSIFHWYIQYIKETECSLNSDYESFYAFILYPFLKKIYLFLYLRSSIVDKKNVFFLSLTVSAWRLLGLTLLCFHSFKY